MTQYGEKATHTIHNAITGERYEREYTYRRAEWHGWHTNNEGDGLWRGDKQILGTCDFSVAGCATLKTAKDKIRRCVKQWEQ